MATPQTYATGSCKIDASDVVSRIFLMSVSGRDQLVLTLIHLMPSVILILLGYWQYLGWKKSNCSLEIATMCFDFYKPAEDGPHANDAVLEYSIIGVMFFFRLVPRMFSLICTAQQFFRFLGEKR